MENFKKSIYCLAIHNHLQEGTLEGINRPLRGVSFDWEMSFLRVAKRRNLSPDSTAINVGFRIVGVEK